MVLLALPRLDRAQQAAVESRASALGPPVALPQSHTCAERQCHWSSHQDMVTKFCCPGHFCPLRGTCGGGRIASSIDATWSSNRLSGIANIRQALLQLKLQSILGQAHLRLHMCCQCSSVSSNRASHACSLAAMMAARCFSSSSGAMLARVSANPCRKASIRSWSTSGA